MKREPSFSDKDLLFRIKVLMILRVVVITVLLGTVVIFQYRVGQLPFILSITILIGITYLLTIFYALLLGLIKDLRVFCYIQTIGDLLVETGVIYITGGIESPFSFLYILTIITASIVLYRPGSYIIASLASILYGTFIDLEFYNIIHPLRYYPKAPISCEPSYLFYIVLINISAFFLVAFLSGYLSERLKKVREELKEKSGDLIELQRFHENVVRSIGSGLLTTDLKGGITSFNQAGEGISGYKFEEVKGLSCPDLFDLPEISMVFKEPIMIGNNPYRCEGIFRRKDGRKIYIGISFSLLRDEMDRVKGVISIFQDITKVKEMEERVARAERFAAIGKISAGIAHEIRNPLASMSGSIQVLKDELTLDGENRRLMEIVVRETDRLNMIIKEFLGYANPKPLRSRRCNINKIIEETLTLLKHSREYNPKIELVISNKIEIWAEIDPEQMKQVFWNLSINAIQAMPDGGKLEITTSYNNQDHIDRDNIGNPLSRQRVKMVFHDTGIGISKEDMAKIFDPFFTTKEGGTGLGLATVYRIIEDHGGSIGIKSQPGKGTYVNIYLMGGNHNLGIDTEH
ncbi:MAG: PAS domain S-box protein [Nitrospinae bacterium]|nr:PAS domain S-box protein [Nitrospinota bacterium]